MHRFKKYILLTILLAGLSIPTAVFAVPSSSGYKDWNNTTGAIKSPTLVGDKFCEETLFKQDPTNFYKETICSLSRVIASAVIDFGTKVNCQIQVTPNVSNYRDNIEFELKPNGACEASGGYASSGNDNIYGNTTTSSKTGFYNNQKSKLTDDIIAPSGESTVQSVFNTIRNITTIIAFLVLILIAFANILHYDINTYAIKKALPSLFIALIGGWLSIFIIYLLSRGIDFLYSISIFSPYQSLNPMLNIFGGKLTSGFSPLSAMMQIFNTADALFNLTPSFVSGILGTIFIVVPAIVVFVFEYLIALRPLVVGILTAIAPIAFLALLLPQTQFIFKKWWTILLIALFFAPFVNLVFYILNQFPTASSSPAVGLVLMLFKTAMIAFLIRMPFTIESDLRNLSVKIAKTGLGEAIGLKKIQAKVDAKAAAEQTISDKILQTPQAQKIIAGIEGKRTLASTEELRRVESIRSRPYIDRAAMLNLPRIFEKANTTNLIRPSSILSQSVSDLKPETFKNILRQSDFRLWQNSGLVSELKNKNGQVLDDQGAAIRADAARKLFRLSQIVEQNKLQNPEAIKTLAQKGALNNLPLTVIQKAIQDGVLTKNDLIPTYKNDTEKAFDRLQHLDLKRNELVSSAQAKILMDRDQKDYSTGFKDMVGLFSNVVKDNKILPPPPSSTIKDIISQMKTHGSDTFENNGMYYLERLGNVQKNAQNTIVSNLQKSGAPVSTSIAIAKNPRVDFDNIKDYVKPESLNGETLGMLREGFINRDLSNSLISEIAGQVSSQKTAVSDAVCTKLSENLKSNQSLNFGEIKKTLKTYMDQKTVSPDSAKTFAEEVNKYVPGSNIQTAGEMSPDAIDETKKHAQSVLEVIEGLSKSGIDEKSLSQNPQKAKTTLKSQITQNIQKAVAGGLPSDSSFAQGLKNISPSSKISATQNAKPTTPN